MPLVWRLCAEVGLRDTTTGQLVRELPYTTMVKGEIAVNVDTMRMACPAINDKSLTC